MKRGTPDHPKTRKLARILGLEPWGAVGILESLWHWTARFAPAGDVGRFDDDDIAQGIGWSADAATLIAALVESGWLDATSGARVGVHDWHEHADDAVHMALARSGKLFTDGKIPKTSKLPKEERERVATLFTNKRTASARRAHGKRIPAHNIPSTPPLPPPLPEPRPAQHSETLPSGVTADAVPLAPADDPARWVNILGAEPGSDEEKLAFVTRELPLAQAEAEQHCPRDRKAQRGKIRSVLIRHYRWQRANPAPARASPRGPQRPVTFAEQSAQNTDDAFRGAFDVLTRRGEHDGESLEPGADRGAIDVPATVLLRDRH